MEKANVLRDFCLSLYKIWLRLKYENKPPNKDSTTPKSDKDRK